MALSVVETNAATFASATATYQVALVSAPVAGDSIFLTAFFEVNPGAINLPTGLGATWTLVYTQQIFGNWRFAVYAGIGGSTSGTITITFTNATTGKLELLNVRGLPSTVLSGVDETSWDITSETQNQPIMMPSRGIPADTLVLTALMKGNSIAPSFPNTGSTAGWVTSAGALATRYVGQAYYLANSTVTSLTIGATPTNITQTDMSVMYIGGPSGTRATAAAGEVLTIGTPQLAADAAYAELLSSFTAALAADTAYAEVLSTTQTAMIEQGAYAEILVPTVLAATVRFVGWGMPR